MESFDPYLNWLGIPAHEQPPTFYRLLGVVLFESNPEVIEQAADLQSLRVGGYQASPQGELCQQLLSEIAMARFCLLDPQQKAAYDAQLHESLSRRGERFVASPPPPMQAPMSGGAAMSMPPQPMMQAAPTLMSAPPGFAPAMPPSAPRAAMPVAAAFPTATAVVARPVTAAPTAPPSAPPAAPQRPLDELENLTSQPAARRRGLKKKKEADYSQQLIIGGVVAAAAVLLFIVYAAVKSQDPSEHGLGGVVPDKPVDKIGAKLIRERKQKEKEIEKEKVTEKERKTATVHAADDGEKSALRPFGAASQRSQAADDGDSQFHTPYKFGAPSRKMDEPEPAGHAEAAPGGQAGPAPGGHAEAAPGPNGHDVSPQDLGSDKDPVLGKDDLEKPDK